MELIVLARKPKKVLDLLRRLDAQSYWELHTKIRVMLEKKDADGAIALILPQGIDSTAVFNRPSFFTPINSMVTNIQTKLNSGVPLPEIASYIIEVGTNSEIANRVA